MIPTREWIRASYTVCRRSLCTVELSRLQEALSQEDWFIPVPEPDSSPIGRGIQNESGALDTVDRDFRWLILEKNAQAQGKGVKLPLRWLEVRVSDLEVVYVIRSPKLIQELGL